MRRATPSPAMRHALGLCALTLALLAACEEPPEQAPSESPSESSSEAPGALEEDNDVLLLARVTPDVGHTQVSTRVTHTDIEMTLAATEDDRTRTGHIVERAERVEHLEVLALDLKATPQTVKLRFETDMREGEIMGEAKKDIHPTQGKSYLLTRADAGLEATYEDGSSPPRREAARVLAQRDTLLGQPLFFDVLPNRLEVGDALTLGVEDLRGLLDLAPEAIEEAEMTLTLEAFDDDLITFSLTLTLSGRDENGLELTLDLQGALTLARATAWPLSLELEGGVQTRGVVPSKEGDIDIQGTGTSAIHYTYTYE